jgi:hypothetical protein
MEEGGPIGRTAFPFWVAFFLGEPERARRETSRAD